MNVLDDRYGKLLARRVPLDNIVVGRAYVIHARNGGVGVALPQHATIGYRLHREKFGRHYLDIEDDYDTGAPHGTAIPLVELQDTPPRHDWLLLPWLRGQEEIHQSTITGAWDVILGRNR